MIARRVLSIFALCAVASAAVAEGDGRSSLSFDGRTATARVEGKGYRLDADGNLRVIEAQPMRSETASVLVDALFAMAQEEVAQARVTELVDGAYNHGKPIPCDCFVTGVKWPFVWTRDSAYSIDLALGWIDPARARRTLEFKISDVREPAATQGLYVVQDTGSGGSWPISTDRVVWFLGAAHLLDDSRFAAQTYQALSDTLAQDRQYVFDSAMGLYRGETSFLDWREQTYPAWTGKDVRFIAESFALSTNVLHYDALKLAAKMAADRHDGAAAAAFRSDADALRTAIDLRFWREDRGLYMSYVGAAGGPQKIEAYDLLGTALAILADIPSAARARAALANYPTWPAGSPVIWPEHRDAAIYHNRAIWPFVSAYALRAARKLDDPNRIAHELRSILLGAALSGSNYENYELISGRVHVDDGKWSGPVVNSPRQLWSVAAMFTAVVEGVFGVGDAVVEPKIPVELVPMLFGERDTIALDLGADKIVLTRPRDTPKDANLLIAAERRREGNVTRIRLQGVRVESAPLRRNAPEFAPDTPEFMPIAPSMAEASDGPVRFYLDGALIKTWKPHNAQTTASIDLLRGAELGSMWTTQVDASSELESLPGPILDLGQFDDIFGEWPRTWTAKRDGRYQVRLRYENRHGPINTGVTAGVKLLAIACDGQADQVAPLVMPHSLSGSISTAAIFEARAGKTCSFALREGFNMSFLSRNKLYTGESGGEGGPLNGADYGELRIVPMK